MIRPKFLLVPVVLSASVLLSACGSSAAPEAHATTTTTPSAPSGTTRNLIVTPAVRESIFRAAAAYHQLPTKDYVGLSKGMTYYAFDPATNSYYAAAGLDPSRHSLKAEIGTQDDGGYNLFIRAASSTKWTVFDDGLGASSEAICPLKIPASVLKVWNWRVKSCFPPL